MHLTAFFLFPFFQAQGRQNLAEQSFRCAHTIINVDVKAPRGRCFYHKPKYFYEYSYVRGNLYWHR
ncbi:hypothetical protein Mapa_010334 [Marchantia paleacea]|nr:hypothetical protein Mapa_010334 [Marchantia paleacea]